MSLITCPECGKEVSDRASACIHCGCPLFEFNNISDLNSNMLKGMCDINGKYYNLTPILDVIKTDRKKTYETLQKITNLDKHHCNALMLIIDKTGKIPKSFNDQVWKEFTQWFWSKDKPVIVCPYCHSTDTKKVSLISRSGSILAFGIGSKKISKQWCCNNCKSYF